MLTGHQQVSGSAGDGEKQTFSMCMTEKKLHALLGVTVSQHLLRKTIHKEAALNHESVMLGSAIATTSNAVTLWQKKITKRTMNHNIRNKQ